MRPAFQGATWDQISLPTIKQYLKKRTAKTRGNREMALLSVIWNWARGEGYTALPWPAAGMERSKWKNTEKPRRMHLAPRLLPHVFCFRSRFIDLPNSARPGVQSKIDIS